MIELYSAIFLFGIGAYLNKNNKKEDSPTNNNNLTFKNNNNGLAIINNESKNNVENVYNNKISEKINELENKYTKEIKQKCDKVVPRSFTEFLDPETRQMYEESRSLERSGPSEMDSDENNSALVSPLTGKPITREQFMTNSNGDTFQPFFGSKVTQSLGEDASTRRLAAHTGMDLDLEYHKKESKPFFKPCKNISYISGAPVKTDILSERYNQSRYRSNERPFKEEKIAAGLNERNGSQGKGGFHQYETQDIVRSGYKDIDDLNVRHQITYTTPVKPGAAISKRGKQSTLFKNRPEKTFHQTMDNQWKTPGRTVGMTQRENFVARENCKKQSRETFGTSGGVNVKHRNIETFRKTRRNVYSNSGLRNVKMIHDYDHKNENSDYGKHSFHLAPNERDTTQIAKHSTNVTSIVKAITKPLEDIMRKTKKQNIVGNPRPNGNMNAQIPSKQTVYDPNDVARTTIKETLIHNNRKGNVKGPTKLTVYDPNDVARTTKKETLIHNNRKGNVRVNKFKNKVYKYDTAPKITIRSTLDQVDFTQNLTRANGANKSTVTVQDKLKETIRETTEDNIYSSNVQYNKGLGHTTSPADAPFTQKQFLSDYEYTGIAGSREEANSNYNSMYNASLNANKQEIAKGRKPMGSNVKLVNGKDKIAVLHKRQMAGVNAERVEQSKVYAKSPSTDNSVYKLKVHLPNQMNDERIDPDILDAYKNNPYTHSLHSYGAVEKFN
jgi:hypothetical protein